MPDHSTVEQQSITTIRTLAMDAVQAANSGHPGTPMALAPGGKPDVLLLASGSEVALCDGP